MENDWEKAADATGVAREDIVSVEPLGEAKHIFSHVEWQMQGYQIRVASVEEGSLGDLIFVEPGQNDGQYAIPSAFDFYTKYIKEENRT